MQVGNIGANVDYQVLDANGSPENVTGATSIVFHFHTPAGAHKQFNGTVFDAINGIFRYTSALSTDFDSTGPWKVQVAYTLSGFTGRTAVGTFTVFENLN